MGLFSRKKRQNAEPAVADSAQESAESAVETPATDGPFDIAEAPSVEGMHNFGVLYLPKQQGVRVQFTINKRTRAAMGALVQMLGSSLTLNVYAAPKTAGLWPDVRDEMVDSITKDGGSANFREGPFGPEVEATIPKKDVNEVRHVRYIGVDGPRWFLRAAVEGQAVMNTETREAIYDYLRKVVVDRGSEAHPVRDLLALDMPEAAQQRVEEKLGKVPVKKPRGPELPELA
ncbi:DUF3710 domain-containing protein [Flaviflexus ciconiae]|uniref:DUF3710 domain-containing protein n=1 Tax=Flaviflexus ciconiae TaxID=2496867 RepID=A0A3S9PVI8_9ACTO|nr:DUF3710 domain-containing protein [Flaviflexus ciconiae]AZQ76386.1 DUF3710 domain-containing protein [Flaviflexus ciconiae]